MKNKANVLSIQFRPKLGDKKTNLEKVKELLSGYGDKELDLILVPEFYTTGINHDAMINYPEPVGGGDVIKFMAELAVQYNTYIVCGSVIEKDGDKLYNTSYVLDRKGDTVGKYRKIHLFNYLGGTEGERITEGGEIVVVDTDFAKLGLSICFDIRYPLHYRKLSQKGAEILLCPTAWGYLNSMSDAQKEGMREVWRSMNITRAAENICYMVSADMCGKVDSFLSVSGNSMISHPFGYTIKNAGEDEGAIYAELDLDELRQLRKVYPAFNID